MAVSIAELNLRYQNFCNNHGLDSSLCADEQIGLSAGQQAWIERHVISLSKAKKLYVPATPGNRANPHIPTVDAFNVVNHAIQ
tara:strand:+ start:181 stop:429 length:249 start_codon:yes stop_codon:yes gene_type:complete